MPSISTQTDHCCDIIGRLNEEFLKASDEITALKNKLRAAKEDAAREYWGLLHLRRLLADACPQLRLRDPWRCLLDGEEEDEESFDELYKTMEYSIPPYIEENDEEEQEEGVTSGRAFIKNMFEDMWEDLGMMSSQQFTRASRDLPQSEGHTVYSL